MTLMIQVVIFIAVLVIVLSYILSHRTAYPIPLGVVSDETERRSQYECGIEPFEEELGIETRERFYMKFYIIAIIFLIFDLESLLLYPITVTIFPLIYTSSPLLYKAYITFLIFMYILVLGLVYEYNKKVL